ncbi:MAG: helix-turn-helix transcriptional regulator [Lachnospiraceae bacterium]|nr:helix-turn-helix transcriptional regulator [Lachnospiraceae bacterium]
MKIYWNKESNSKNLIGQKVMELRLERKLSQKALAEQLQLAGYEFSDLTVLRIEKGTRFVPDYEVVALADFFHVSCEYLLGIRTKR